MSGQFRKGESGNPGGVPGLAKTLQARLKLALEEALQGRVFDLRSDEPDAMGAFAKSVVRRSLSGSTGGPQTLLALIEKFDALEGTGRHSVRGPSEEKTDKMDTNSLAQGDSQGVSAKAPSGEIDSEEIQ